jgi:hypothetical protein
LDAVVSDAAEHLAHLNIQKELAATHLKGWIRLSHMSQMIMTCWSLYMLILLIRLDPLSNNNVTFGYVWLFLVSDAQRRKELVEMILLRCAASGDVGDSDITVKDFIENCRQFEDDLCKKYGVQKEQLLYTPNIENIVSLCLHVGSYKII